MYYINETNITSQLMLYVLFIYETKSRFMASMLQRRLAKRLGLFYLHILAALYLPKWRKASDVNETECI
jgi:hypothetical protein